MHFLNPARREGGRCWSGRRTVVRNGTAKKKAGFWHFCTTLAPAVCPREGKRATGLRGGRGLTQPLGCFSEDPFLPPSVAKASKTRLCQRGERVKPKIHALPYTDRHQSCLNRAMGHLKARAGNWTTFECEGWQLDMHVRRLLARGHTIANPPGQSKSSWPGGGGLLRLPWSVPPVYVLCSVNGFECVASETEMSRNPQEEGARIARAVATGSSLHRTWIRGRRNCKLRMLTSRPYTFARCVSSEYMRHRRPQVTSECNVDSGSQACQLLALTFSCFVFRVPAWGQEVFPPTRDVGCLLMVGGADKSKRSRRDGLQWILVAAGPVLLLTWSLGCHGCLPPCPPSFSV